MGKANGTTTGGAVNVTSDSIGRRLSGKDGHFAENGSRNLTEDEAKVLGGSTKSMKVEEAPTQTFMQVLMTPLYWWSVITMSLTQIRLISYMGWLELYFKSSAERLGYTPVEINESIDFYVQVFGILQINCFFMAPVIGSIMDWRLKPKKSKDIKMQSMSKQDVNGNTALGQKRNIKKQQITNLFRAFLVTNLMLTLFGVVVQIDTNLPLQFVAFVLHTIVRTFLHSSTGALYACMFHFSHLGKLTGLTSFLGAVAILVQDPLFVLINDQLNGNPFWVNFGLLILTITGFGLPLTLWLEAR